MYGALTYRGDLTELGSGLEVPREDGGQTRRVSVLLGSDVFGHPYEVLDVELERFDVTTLADPVPVYEVRTRVHVQPASIDTTRGNRSAALHQQRDRAEQLAEHARVRHFWRPDVWAPAPAHTVAAA